MELYPEWLTNDSFVFVLAEHVREAALLDNPAVKQYWFVQVDGAGDGMRTDTLRTHRTKLTNEERQKLESYFAALQQPEVDRNALLKQVKRWQKVDLPASCAKRFVPVTRDSFSPDFLDNIVPMTVLQKQYPSPGWVA